MPLLSFNQVAKTCQSLEQFAKARNQPQPDKDLILTVKKIDGSELLLTTRLSEMSWLSRAVRWLGFGRATLGSVAKYLSHHEPYLPKFYQLADRDLLAEHYSNESIEAFRNMEKQKFKELQAQKSMGCEALKNCVIDHNLRRYHKIYFSLKETEKTQLGCFGGFENDLGYSHSWPNPMGSLQTENAVDPHVKYQAPIIEPDAFLFLESYSRKVSNTALPSRIAGFCYEYGLGAKVNINEAKKHYQIAANQNEYSAYYNLGRLAMKENDLHLAIGYFKKGEAILLEKIDNFKKIIERLGRQIPQNTPKSAEINAKRRQHASEYENLGCYRSWKKSLRQIYAGLVAAYKLQGVPAGIVDYQKKIEELDKLLAMSQ